MIQANNTPGNNAANTASAATTNTTSGDSLPAAASTAQSVAQSVAESVAEPAVPDFLALVRYGRVPQVARFGLSSSLRESLQDDSPDAQDARLPAVVVQTDRGVEVGTLLEVIRPGLLSETPSGTGELLRLAADSDITTAATNGRDADLEFFDWQQRIADWDLQLQVIDMEWTLDRDNVILYVLNDQNAETTRLALLAAAGGYGIIHVQPVNAAGIDYSGTGSGGCGSGCGSGGCGH